jgi:hypothetical protein
MYYARLPQQVLDGVGRATLALGDGTDSLPNGRDVLATLGFGSMWTGFVPPPNMDHHLSVSSSAPVTRGDARMLLGYL